MNYSNGPASQDEDYFEFRLRRAQLFQQYNGGLVAVKPDDTEYATFSTHGIDSFESGDLRHIEPQRSILARCRSCHVDSGIHSVQSRLEWLHHSVAATDDPVAWETRETILKKEFSPEFRSLIAVWQ